MSTPENPNVSDRSNTTFFTGPAGENNTQLTGLLFIDIDTLPTSNPMVAGQIWSNSGVLTVSAG